VATSGYPTPVLTETGTLPGGITLIDDGDGTARLSGTSADATAGTWPFTITASNGVGPTATQSFVLKIKPAPLWITADSAVMTVGGTPPVIGAQYVGFHDGDAPANLTTPPVCTTTATAHSVVGVYPSTCSGAIDPDYVMTYFKGTVAVQGAFVVTTTTLPAATPGTVYHAILRASGGHAPYRWNTTSTFPAGLHLTDAGVITGRVKTGLPPGSYALAVSVQTRGSKKSPAQTASASLTLVVN
jgi:hypothetical protein